MRSIGGYIRPGIHRRTDGQEDVTLLNTGRNALECLLRIRGYRVLFAPIYTCSVLREPIARCNVELRYYNIDKAFNPLLEAVLEAGDKTISALAARSIIGTCEYMGLPTQIILSSAPFNNQALARNERQWDLCRQTGSNCCVVPTGGSTLYDKEEFRNCGVELLYLKAALNPYPQGHMKSFVPSLSILDMLMWCGREEAKALLTGYSLA